MFKSDIRSMINFLQSNHTPTTQLIKEDIITPLLWEELIDHVNHKKNAFVIDYIIKKSSFYNLEVKTFLVKFIYYLTSNKSYVMVDEWINLFKFIIHQGRVKEQYILIYTVKCLEELYKLL